MYALRHSLYQFIAVLALFFAVALVITALRLPSVTRGKAEFAAKRLMTETEVLFFGLLRSAVPEFHIFPQVAMGALLSTNDWRNRGFFSQKVVDFVICQAPGMAVIAVVELDDWSHDRKSEKDRARDQMLASAGYVTFRWDCRALPTIDEIRSAVLSAGARPGL